MKRNVVIPLFVAALVMLAVSWSWAGGHGDTKPVKKAVLLVAFGTSVPQAQKAFDSIEAEAKKAFSDADIRWAFTSKIIRNKLAKQGKKLDPPVVALAKLMEENFTHVVVASFHSLPGEEFHDLYTNVHAFMGMKDGFQRILLSRPLLSSRKDMERVAKARAEIIAQISQAGGCRTNDGTRFGTSSRRCRVRGNEPTTWKTC